MGTLTGHVAIVAGATRGAGRGIARMLGEAGATVYCTGRSSRAQPNTSAHVHAGRKETIEETAELVTAAGGAGIAVRVDHTNDEEVAALFARVQREQQRLDVLVNILTYQPVTAWKSVWNLPLAESRTFVDGWLWPHIVTCWHAAGLMVKRTSGLMVEVIEQEGIGYHGQLFFDLMEMSLKRLSFALAQELAPKGVAAVAVAPGFMRTEAILEGFGATEATWRDAAETNPKAKSFGFIASETPCFVGRGVAALAADPNRLRKSGGIFSSWALAEEYGLTDLDGTRPNMPQYMQEHFPRLVNGKPATTHQWRLVTS
jgi:NAD(P)-dependent dehydrogenase (short-subunit alcohol dehydrogenase family)